MEISENTPRRFWERIRSLIEPPPNIADIRQRHQTRLLSALLLIIILLGGFSGTIQLLTVPGFLPTFVAIFGAGLVLCFAYFLARTKYYLFAATLTALTPFLASYAALLKNTEDQSAFVFMLISVLLSSMLLNRRLTLSVATLNLLGLFLLPVIQPAWTVAVLYGKISFHIMISALILIAMWHRDRIERDRQRELAESELKFRSIFDHSVDAIGVSKDGVHIMANPAYVRMFGCESADSLVGKSVLNQIAPSERARIQENVRRRSMGEDVPIMYETRGLRCDGSEFDMEVHVSTYELEGKLYTVPILRDVTERKRSEETLRASEEAYKLLFESNPQPMWVYDINSLAFLAVNDEAVARYGYSREEFLQMTIKDIRPSEDVPRLMENIAHLSGGLDHAGTWRHIKKGGSLIDVEITSHVLSFEGKQAELVIANDITARKAAEDALRKSEFRYRAVVEGTTDLICRFLPDTTLTFVSEAYCVYLGKSREELIGTRFLNLIPKTDWAGVQDHIAAVIRNRKPVTYSQEVCSPEREIRWQQWTDSTIQNEDGDVVELQSVGRDITEHKRAEAERENLIRELTEKNSELERFTYTVSHDLKAPLITIAGFLGYLEQDAASGNIERLKADTRRIREAVYKMEQLLNELLELSRIGRIVNPSQIVPFEEITRDALEIVHGQLESRQVAVQIQSDLPAVFGDRQRLTEVLQNLLDNAAKFMGVQSEPRIEIGQVGEENGNPVFYVKDNGIGIPPEYSERVFGLFNKLDAKSDGTGIGLALVKRIIEFHGGRIWVESESGNGSTFLFTLPVSLGHVRELSQ